MVRISIPTLPKAPLIPPSGLSILPLPQAASYLAQFLENGKGNTVMLTGAGVSVDSGIRAYRGEKGTYSNPNYKPILYHELVEDSDRGDMFRRRYWARSFLGYPPVRDAQANPTHIYIAALQHLGLAPKLITQNVDNLHRKAYSLLSPTYDKSSILELHGTLAKVHCLKHRHEQTRDIFQEDIARMNPIWDQEAKEAERTGTRPRTNPDGDVELHGVDYRSFNVPPCRICEKEKAKASMVKPNVVFFGETITPEVRDESLHLISSSSSLLILGTSLATYSAFRLVKLAVEHKKPVLMITTGPTRADPFMGNGLDKMDRVAGDVLGKYLDEAVKISTGKEVEDVKRYLHTGVVKRPPEVEGPRAEG
ncbi:hypothetical protein L486_01183 [Kwoniella mangroviensis CBS 10435]|uniref:Deacetylase sirtuin-type domain-containing protein n=1 Tax=Kwoniella mangroviensis CBS 10435 TaxID=1331196 RepID=A0A1B9J186_9TREE|nr:hypothetical protein L486_01183 [Kwoniella mangroviensis CBS 10435]OCF77557.1 hypothetical protein I204_01547 [Kwoniella mangroviensis CBS 8886]